MLLLMILTGFSEMISLGLLFPFLAILIDQSSIWDNNFFSSILSFFRFNKDSNIMLLITICFSLASIIANGLRLLNLWFNVRISQMIGNDLNYEAFYRTLNQPYLIHKNRNSDVVIVALTNHIKLIIDSVEYILLFFSSSLILTFLLFTLLSINPLLAFNSLLVLIFSYLFIASKFKDQLLINGKKIAFFSQKQINIIQESLGGIREIIINDKANYYSNLFKEIDMPLRKIGSQSSFIGGFPRYLMEAIALTLIAFLSYIMLRNTGSATNIIPFLGVLALSAQKMLPALQQIFKSWSCLQSTHKPILEFLNLINQPIAEKRFQKRIKPLKFVNYISFQNVSFRYESKGKLVLNNISFKINKGEKIGIVGKTGSGKSTLIDLIMGLLEPNQGLITVDGKNLNNSRKSKLISSWQKNIAHVPQNIYISDASFAENIAFGIKKEEIEIKKLFEASEKANIREFIESTPNKYETKLGERGAKISGGQRQRIAIARALYQDKKVLVLDEATSSLDSKTESSVMESLKKLPVDITIIMISHRRSTLKNCDQIISLNSGLITITKS